MGWIRVSQIFPTNPLGNGSTGHGSNWHRASHGLQWQPDPMVCLPYAVCNQHGADMALFQILECQLLSSTAAKSGTWQCPTTEEYPESLQILERDLSQGCAFARLPYWDSHRKTGKFASSHQPKNSFWHVSEIHRRRRDVAALAS